MKIYISGQISGLPFDEVKLRFSQVEEELVNKGYEVTNPFRNGIPDHAPYEIHMAMDIILLMGCDAIYLLPDWNCSRSATLEKNIAEFTGKTIIYQETAVFTDIKQAIAETMGISFYEIVGESRNRCHVYARMIFSYYCRNRCATVVQIANYMKHNHSTITYYLRKFSEDNRFNPEFKRLVKQVENALLKIENCANAY
ncbi:Chromosomal replication initiator protein DnaA [termite gut metagenome]|uniref:Chromosomal replication initiator protein DnaA n=1 Tax=termite gut metagenome TaxID=433724 RepID=A0A5J4QQY7_9ZZZZ